MEQRITRNSLALLCAVLTIIPINELRGQCAWTSAERDPLLTNEVFAGDPGSVSCTSDNTKAIISSATKGIAEYDFATNQLKSMGSINANVRKTLDLGDQIAAVGGFSAIEDAGGTKEINGVALFNKASRTWSGLGQGIVDGEAKAIASIGTRLIVGGSFTAVKQGDGSELAVNGLAQYNTATKLWTKWGNGLVSGDVRSIAVTGSSATDKIFVAGQFDQVITADGEHTLNSKNLVSYPALVACKGGSACVAEPSVVGFRGVGVDGAAASSVQSVKYDALSNKLAVGGSFGSILISERSILKADNIASLDVETNTFSGLGGARGTVTNFSKQAGNSRSGASKYLFTQADAYSEDGKGRVNVKNSKNGSQLLAVDGKVASLDLATNGTSARTETGAEGGDVLGLATCGNSEVMVGNYATFNGEDAGEGAGFCDAAVLAVELSSFSLKTTENGNELEWSTSSETNNSGFEVQRSINGEDFVVLSFVSGFGTTESAQNYQYFDNIETASANSMSYRLKQIDFDGTAWFSKSIEASIDLPQAMVLEQNYPNPFNPSTSIKFSLPQAENVRLEVFNSVGQQVALIVNGNMEAGHHKIDFDASGFSSGVYLYSLTSGGSTIQKIMTIQK